MKLDAGAEWLHPDGRAPGDILADKKITVKILKHTDMNVMTTLLLSLLFLLQPSLRAYAQDMYMSTSFREPATEGLRFIYSRDAIHWDTVPGIFLKPSVGAQKVLRDPSIIRTPDGIFRLVWTSSWRGDKGFGYSESKDLMHWSEPRFIEVMEDTTTVNVWAPELFWDADRGEAMVVWASCVPGKFPDGEEEHKNNHRLYYSVTKDFKMFTKGKLLYDPGFSSIDATILERADKDYVMVFKDNTRRNRNIRVAFANDAHGPWSSPSASFTSKLTEGPTVVELPIENAFGCGGYLIYYDRYGNHDFGASYTKDFKSFKNVSAKVSVPSKHKHGTIFRVTEEILTNLIKSRK